MLPVTARNGTESRNALASAIGRLVEPGHGLVVDRNRLDVVPALVKGIDELDVAVPAQAECIGHLLANEVVDDDLGTVEHVLRHRSCFSWLAVWSGAQSIEGLIVRQA